MEEVSRAIRSFPNGSAKGPGGLRPQHLKDMTNSSNAVDFSFLTALAFFSTLVLEGKTPVSIHGATLAAMEKDGGGVIPIAMGCTLRQMVDKIAGNKVMEE